MSSGKNGFVISETIRPSSRLFPDTRARACVLGRYLRSATAFQTREASTGSTEGTWLTVRETVAIDTRACAATAWISIRVEVSLLFFVCFIDRSKAITEPGSLRRGYRTLE